MVILKILNADGSTYWTTVTNSKEESDKWLVEEQKRPYWKKEFTIEIEDKTEEYEEQVEEAKKKMEQAIKDRSSRLTALLTLKKKQSLSSKETSECLSMILDHLEISEKV